MALTKAGFFITRLTGLSPLCKQQSLYSMALSLSCYGQPWLVGTLVVSVTLHLREATAITFTQSWHQKACNLHVAFEFSAVERYQLDSRGDLIPLSTKRDNSPVSLPGLLGERAGRTSWRAARAASCLCPFI